MFSQGEVVLFASMCTHWLLQCSIVVERKGSAVCKHFSLLPLRIVMIAVICLLDFFFFFLQNKARSENAWDLYFSIAPCFFFFFFFSFLCRLFVVLRGVSKILVCWLWLVVGTKPKYCSCVACPVHCRITDTL